MFTNCGAGHPENFQSRDFRCHGTFPKQASQMLQWNFSLYLPACPLPASHKHSLGIDRLSVSLIIFMLISTARSIDLPFHIFVLCLCRRNIVSTL
jgi:hypothetical protein